MIPATIALKTTKYLDLHKWENILCAWITKLNIQPQFIFKQSSIVTCPQTQNLVKSRFIEIIAKLNLTKLYQIYHLPNFLIDVKKTSICFL